MSSGQKPRTPDCFPNVKRRRHGRRYFYGITNVDMDTKSIGIRSGPITRNEVRRLGRITIFTANAILHFDDRPIRGEDIIDTKGGYGNY